MSILTPSEELSLSSLVKEKQDSSELFKISIMFHLLGGAIGWISFLVFLLLAGLPVGLISALSAVAMFFIIFTNDKGTLSSSLSLVLMIASHLTFMITLNISLHLELYSSFILESLLLALTFIYYQNKAYLFLQSGLWFWLAFIMTWEYGAHLYMPHIIFALSHVLLIVLWMKPSYQYFPIRLSLLLTQSFIVYIYYFHTSVYYHPSLSFSRESFLATLSTISSLFLSAYLFYTFKSLRSSAIAMIAIVLLALINILLNQPFALVLLFLALSYYSNEKFMKLLTLFIFAVFLFSYYYMLSISFSDKALVLMLTGLIFLAISYSLKRLKVIS